MRNMVLRCAVLLICASVSLAAQQPPKQAPQEFTVLRSAKLVASTESLTNAEANCAIAGASSGATMQCRPGRTGKSMYNFNTALVVDSQGMAYVIACRVTLVYFWCKTPAAGQMLEGTMNGTDMAIEDGNKTHDYQVLTSQNIGPLPQTQPPTAAKGAPVASGQAARTLASASRSKKVADNQEKPGSDAAATCLSPAGACVTFVSDPQGADIYVDGKFAGNTPSMLTLSPGAHDIRVEASRLKPWTRTLEAGAGSKITIRAELEAQPPQN